MVKKLPIIREIFKGDHNVAAAVRKHAKPNKRPCQGRLIMKLQDLLIEVELTIERAQLTKSTYKLQDI